MNPNLIDKQPLSETLGLVLRSHANDCILDLDLELVQNLLRKYGVLLFRGFSVGNGDFSAFTSRFLDPHQLHDSSNGNDDRVTTVYDGEHSVVYHAELSSTPLRPDLIWFHCVTPPVRSGETTVCDGIRILERLKPATQSAFMRKRLRFFGPLGPNMSRTILRIDGNTELRAELAKYSKDFRYKENSPGNVVAEFFTFASQLARYPNAIAFANAILPFSRLKRVTFEGGFEIPNEFIRDVEIACELGTVLIKWQRDDIAMIDNWRCMHGRNSFRGPRIITSVFGKANF
jgi:hypothetical protein